MPLFFWIGTPKYWLHFFRTIYVEEKLLSSCLQEKGTLMFHLGPQKQVKTNLMKWNRHKEQNITLLIKQFVGAKTKKVFCNISKNEENTVLNHFYGNPLKHIFWK